MDLNLKEKVCKKKYYNGRYNQYPTGQLYIGIVNTYTAKLNGCFDLAVVILVAVLSDNKGDKSLSSLVIITKEDKLRKIKPCHYHLRQFPV